MSKYVKQLLVDDIKSRLEGVSDVLLVDVIGLDANASQQVRKELREKDIQLLAIKNSMAARATEGTALAPVFEGLTGSAAVVWGAEDVVSLAKEVIRLASAKEYESLTCRGGVMDGQRLSPEEVTEISKWPTREEQLSILMGQILGVGATLAGQIGGPGGTLAGQIQEKGGGDDSASDEE